MNINARTYFQKITGLLYMHNVYQSLVAYGNSGNRSHHIATQVYRDIKYDIFQ